MTEEYAVAPVTLPAYPTFLFPPMSAEYDDGYFDKDEQGWCSAWTSVVSTPGGEVRIRQWGDRNGLDAYERTIETRVAQHLAELQLVKLEAWPWYFDLAKNRLLSADTTEHLVRRPAKGEWWKAPRVEQAMDFLFALAHVLGFARLEAAGFSGWPERGPEVDAYTFTKVHFPLGTQGTLDLRWRPATGADCVPELSLHLVLPRVVTYLTVSERGELFIGGSGPFELRAAARAAAEAWDW